MEVDPGPFEFGDVGGTGPALLCLHGFTGTPYEVRYPAEVLARRGFACFGPALPGHCETPEKLNHTRREEWVEASLAHFDQLAATHSRVYLMGLSMGALLGLWVCTRRQVPGALILAAPLDLGLWVRSVVPLLARFVPSLPKSSDIVDDEARARHPSYTRLPLSGLVELMALQRELVPMLGQVEAPLCLIYSQRDRAVRFSDADRILQSVSSHDVELHTLRESGHVMPVDLQRDEVTREALRFFERLERGPDVDGGPDCGLDSTHNEHRWGA
jgi:carboxylesterase